MLFKKSRRKQFTIFTVIFGIIVVLGFVLRVYDLDVKPVHFDEGVHWNHFIQKVVDGKAPDYSPHFHGFTSWYLSAIPLTFMELSITTLRIAVAIAGALVVALWWFLRKYIGTFGTLVSGLFVALSPALIFYGRHVAQHTYFILFLLAAVLLMNKYLSSLKERYLYLWAIVMGLLYTTHEFALVFIAILVSFVAVLYYLAIDAKDMRHHVKRIKRAMKPRVIIIGIILFGLVITVIMSSFFTNSANLVEFLKHQISPFEFEKTFNTGHNKPFLYYATLFLPIEIFAFLGTVLALVFFRRTYFSQFVLYWTGASFFIFSMIPYKIPWLFVIVLLPMYILSGITLEEVMGRIRGKWKAQVVLFSVLVALVSYTGYTTITFNYISPTAHARQNPLNYVGPVDDAYRMIADLERLVVDMGSPRILITTEGAPALEYYLRNENFTMISDDDMDLAPYYDQYDMFIIHPTATYDLSRVNVVGRYEMRENYFVNILEPIK